MDSKNELVELMVQQGKNVLVSMKDLKRRAKKKGKERSDLYEKLSANQHSFGVYTYIDSAIEQLAEVQAFMEKVELFSAEFFDTVTNFDAEVNVKNAEALFEDAVTGYNSMVSALGHAEKAVKEKEL